ncbi:MAG: hypothetical protein RID07_12220 [Lacipirellulaceae bacterium]
MRETRHNTQVDATQAAHEDPGAGPEEHQGSSKNEQSENLKALQMTDYLDWQRSSSQQ